MTMTARDIMRTGVQVVQPSISLTDLERRSLEKSVGGFPVVRAGKLVGVVRFLPR